MDAIIRGNSIREDVYLFFLGGMGVVFGVCVCVCVCLRPVSVCVCGAGVLGLACVLWPWCLFGLRLLIWLLLIPRLDRVFRPVPLVLTPDRA